MPLPTWDHFVLVVEDDLALRNLYRAALRGAGHSVIAVEDGLDALRIIERQRPAVVVLDLGLPRVSGRDVLRELKAKPDTRDIPIVVVTGTDIRDLNLDHFAHVLRKPITTEHLMVAVGGCMRRGPGSAAT